MGGSTTIKITNYNKLNVSQSIRTYPLFGHPRLSLTAPMTSLFRKHRYHLVLVSVFCTLSRLAPVVVSHVCPYYVLCTYSKNAIHGRFRYDYGYGYLLKMNG